MKFHRPAAVALLLLSAASAWAVKTEVWTQTTADDFNKGTTDGVVVTARGQLRLSRKIESMLPKDSHFDAIPAIAEAPDGSIVFGAFPSGEVQRLKDGKLTTVATFKDQAITSIAFDSKGRLLVGAGGDKGRVYRVEKDGEKPKVIFEQDDVKYVWAIVPHHTSDGDTLLLATGPTGGVYELAADDSAKEIATLDGNNVLCLIVGPDGNFYAGTDGEGLVYRIDAKTDKAFALYDAAESEISALAFDKVGNLLAATSEVKKDAAAAAADKTPQGKPEKSAAGESLDGKAPAAPKPPDNKPGESIPGDKPVTPQLDEPLPTTDPSKAAAGTSATAAAAATAGSGNAVYRIDKQGFATELWRGDVVIYGMAVSGDAVLLATGDDGQIEELRPNEEEAGVLARTDGASVSAILPAKDGSLLVATSDSGAILKISGGYAKSGAYESDVLDAGMTALLGKMHLIGTLPEGTAITVETRSGNVKDPETGGWEDWTAPVPAKEFVPVTSPAARFMQYRLTLSSTADDKTPIVDEISTAYQKPNVAPRITAVTVTPTNDITNPGGMTISWEANDANEDEIRYSIYVKAQGQAAWMKLAADLTETTHVWSSKGVADGRYDVKVVASDAKANPPGQGKEASRISDAVLVDNTPPVIGDVKIEVADAKATVKLRVVDRAGTVASLESTLDSVDHWQKQLPDDTIADSPEETYTLSLGTLPKGQHAVTVRATDERGNAALETVTISVP